MLSNQFCAIHKAECALQNITFRYAELFHYVDPAFGIISAHLSMKPAHPNHQRLRPILRNKTLCQHAEKNATTVTKQTEFKS